MSHKLSWKNYRLNHCQIEYVIEINTSLHATHNKIWSITVSVSSEYHSNLEFSYILLKLKMKKKNWVTIHCNKSNNLFHDELSCQCQSYEYLNIWIKLPERGALSENCIKKKYCRNCAGISPLIWTKFCNTIYAYNKKNNNFSHTQIYHSDHIPTSNPTRDYTNICVP